MCYGCRSSKRSPTCRTKERIKCTRSALRAQPRKAPGSTEDSQAPWQERDHSNKYKCSHGARSVCRGFDNARAHFGAQRRGPGFAAARSFTKREREAAIREREAASREREAAFRERHAVSLAAEGLSQENQSASPRRLGLSEGVTASPKKHDSSKVLERD